MNATSLGRYIKQPEGGMPYTDERGLAIIKLLYYPISLFH